jgi:hypothetical protein
MKIELDYYDEKRGRVKCIVDNKYYDFPKGFVKKLICLYDEEDTIDEVIDAKHILDII